MGTTKPSPKICAAKRDYRTTALSPALTHLGRVHHERLESSETSVVFVLGGRPHSTSQRNPCDGTSALEAVWVIFAESMARVT
jgi:hypothetical protein